MPQRIAPCQNDRIVIQVSPRKVSMRADPICEAWRAALLAPDAFREPVPRHSPSSFATPPLHLRRILCWHGYPSGMQEPGTLTVIEQRELLSEGLAAA